MHILSLTLFAITLGAAVFTIWSMIAQNLQKVLLVLAGEAIAPSTVFAVYETETVRRRVRNVSVPTVAPRARMLPLAA